MPTILVPVDGSAQSAEALAYAAELFPNGQFRLLYVADPVAGITADDPPQTVTERIEEQEREAGRVFASAREALDADSDVPIETVTRTGAPWREIVDYTEDNDIDHIVMGSHGRDGTARLLLGSVAELVVRRAPVPVTVVT